MTVGAVAIGIDFGTAYCCAGVFRNGMVEIIPDDQGQRTMPSFVRFTERQIFVGSAAQSQAAINPPNTIYDVKRLIGRSLNDLFFKDKDYPFKTDKEEIEVQYKGQTKRLSPIEVASILLMRIKENAEAYLGHAVTAAVVSVPAHFTNSQRLAMLNAAEIAGLNVLRLINEPSAAAVAYAFENITRRSNVLVFDLGAGKLDVTILELNNGAVRVKSTAGDPNIGGADFDTCLVNHFKKVFERDHRMSLTDPRALRRLRNACEKAKKELSFSTTSYVQVEPLMHGIDFNKLVTRELFEKKCDELFRKLIDPVKQALKDANLDKSQIDEILLVGGSTRIPKIQELLTTFFERKVLNKSVNADEAVAYGAAIIAAKDFDDQTPDLKKIVLGDINPYTIFMELSNGIAYDVLKNCTPTAHEKCWLFPQPIFNANTTISLFENLGKNCSTAFVANCHISGFHRVHERVNEPKLTFMVDNSGIVLVTASQTVQSAPVDAMKASPNPYDEANGQHAAQQPCTDVVSYTNGYDNRTAQNQAPYDNAGGLHNSVVPNTSGGEVQRGSARNQCHQSLQMNRVDHPRTHTCPPVLEVVALLVECSKRGLSPGEIAALKCKAEEYKRDEDAQKARIQAKDSCERYARNLREFIAKEAPSIEGITATQRTEILARCDDLLGWIERSEISEPAEIYLKQKELERTCMPVIQHLRQGLEYAEADVAAAKRIAGNDQKKVDVAQKMADAASLQYMTFCNLATAPKVSTIGNLQTCETSV